MAGRISYSYQRSLIERQQESEDKMLKEFEAGNYTIDNPMVVVNPYLIVPLSAVVLFMTDTETAVTVTVRGKERYGDIRHTFPKAQKHILPVLGLYAGYENKVEIELYRGKKKTITIQTEELDKDVPVCISMKTSPGYLRDQMIFISPALNQLATAYDYRGDIRWHINVPTVFDIKRLRNGNLLMSTERLIEMPYYMSGLYEMSMTGKIYREYSLPGGTHHDDFEMPDGSLLVLTEDLRSDTVEDMCVLIDRESGEILKTWDFKDVLTPGEGRSGSATSKDWFHNNAVWYDEKTNSLTFSGRHVDAMINLDFDTGKLNWIIGDPTGWPEEKLPYFFKPVNEPFEWQYEQHACVVTPDGDVMCFDNGHYRSKIKEHYLKNKDNYSRGVRYHINTDEMTIEQVWQYGKERGADFFSQYISNVEYYGEGHYMVHSGGIQYYKGEAYEGFAANMQGDPDISTRSVTLEVLNDEVVLELVVEGNYYRGEKLSLYHDMCNLKTGPAKRLGHMGVTKEFDTIIEMDSCYQVLPDRYAASIKEEDDRFTFKATFEKGQLVMLTLEKGEEKHGYYISTSANQLTALCCGTFVSKDDRDVTLSVNKAGLRGLDAIKVIVDDEKYATGITVDCGRP